MTPTGRSTRLGPEFQDLVHRRTVHTTPIIHIDYADLELRVMENYMTDFNYQDLAARTCPAPEQHRYDLLPREHLMTRMVEASEATAALDSFKRAFAYAKPTVFGDVHPPLPEQDVKVTLLLHMILGIVTEAGELLDAIMPVIFDGKPLDEVNIKEELGDINWYRVNALRVVGQTPDDNDRQNIAKLFARFPTKFDPLLALNRDTDAERAVLEAHPVEVTAELHNVTLYSYGPGHDRARGAIYGDKKERFVDGEVVHSSMIKEIKDGVIHTNSGNAYRIIGEYQDDRQT